MPLSLNQNELETLRILWERGESKPAEIESNFAWPIENATLRSVLVNLVEKGQITRELRGKAYFYSAKVPKSNLLQDLIRSLSRIFAGGSPQALVAQLVNTEDIGEGDLKVIREIASKASPTRTPAKSRGSKTKKSQ